MSEKSTWIEPKLSSLDVEETLGGIIIARNETFVTDQNGTLSQNINGAS